MGLLGSLLSLPVNLINIPASIVDDALCDGDKVFSAPLDALAQELKKVDE